MVSVWKLCVLSALAAVLPQIARGAPLLVSGDSSRITFAVDASSRTYALTYQPFGWTLSGHATVQDPSTGTGHDSLGDFRSISFRTDRGVQETVQVYQARPVVLFKLTYLAPTHGNGPVFPDFHSIPQGLQPFSYRDQNFAPPTFNRAQTCTPWLFFDPTGRSMIVSPASNFMLETMTGEASIGCGLNPSVGEVPAGFEQTSVIAFDQGIGACWGTWGSAMRALYRRPVPSNQRGPLLRDFGYWTDNGADYYYNYEPESGYAGTLLALRKRYRDEGIPLGYLQLDSWWYDKSTNDPDGRPGGATKNAKLPPGLWNRYGGLMEYRADRDLFPNGLQAFDQKLGLPLAVHNRWMDRKSPYHRDFQISGVAVTDPRWWDQTAEYLATSGVACYEQDWLDRIYQNSPEMASQAGVGDAFTDGMARACAAHGLDMQYCMASPRFFLQGLRYPNLTTIRTSDDRFDPGKWSNFLFVSQLAQEVGIWPWCDVFKSGETGNMILSVLSAGSVGTGDRIGQEDKRNILEACRPDGVLVKPDRSLFPCDQSYLEPNAPLLASTYTDHRGLRTLYLFAFPRGEDHEVHIRLDRLMPGARRWYVHRFKDDTGRFIRSDQEIVEPIDSLGHTYLMAAPVTGSGIVLLGDPAKFVPTGKQRIPSIQETAHGVTFEVAFAAGEHSVRIDGVSPQAPRIDSSGATLVSYDIRNGRFSVEVMSEGRQRVRVGLSN